MDSIQFFRNTECRGSVAVGTFADLYERSKVNVVVGVPCESGNIKTQIL